MAEAPFHTFDAETFLRGKCLDVGAWFGMHLVPGEGLWIRAFLPRAQWVEVLDAKSGEPLLDLVMVHPEGLFEAHLPKRRKVFPYRFRIHGWGEPVEWVDPYRFGPVLGELDHYLHAEGTLLRSYTKMGAHVATREGVEGADFAVWAPNAKRVSVVGNFNGWDGRRHILRRWSSSGIWELFVPHLRPGDLYKFEILGQDGKLLPLKSDPYAYEGEYPPGSASILSRTEATPWHDGAWMKARSQRNRHTAPVSIFEMHLGSWKRREDGGFLSYRELADLLVPYVKDLGFTHVQFLPVSEHPFYASWGYQPLGLFTPTARYGTPEDFQALVDAFHGAGIGVLLDWVPAHFPEDMHGLASFDGTHLFEHADPRKGRHMDWGTLIYNFGRREVQNFLIANALYWLDRFHIDGLRVDAVASMLYLDYSRKAGQWVPNRHGGRENLEAVDFLRRLNETVYAQFPDTLTVAEESTAWPQVSRPTSGGGLGFGFKWNMGWMHDTLRFLGRNMLHRKYHQQEITFSMLYQDSENYVLPLSHDEVVHGKKSLLWRMPGTRWEQFANLRLLYAYQWAHPGKKLLFMGCEFGQDHEWDHNRALDWNLLEFEEHRGIQNLVRDLNHVYRQHSALFERDCEPGGLTWIDCNDRKNAVLSLLRWGFAPGDHVLVVLNLTAQPREGFRIGVPSTGRYTEILNTDASLYGGQNMGNLGWVPSEPIPMHGHPNSVTLTLPALGVLYLKPEPPTPARKKS